MGQNPSAKAAGKNNTFDRLNEWTARLGIKSFAFVNACDKVGSVKQKDIDLDNLSKAVYRFNKVIAIGNFASEALARINCKHFKLPHPSPLNRLINDPQYIASCLDNCRVYLSE